MPRKLPTVKRIKVDDRVQVAAASPGRSVYPRTSAGMQWGPDRDNGPQEILVRILLTSIAQGARRTVGKRSGWKVAVLEARDGGGYKDLHHERVPPEEVDVAMDRLVRHAHAGEFSRH